MRKVLFILGMCLHVVFAHANDCPKELKPYPTTKVVDVVDDYHGTKVSDPFRWLEQDSDSPEVRDWIERQNSFTEEYLSAIPLRKYIKDRLSNLWNFDTQSIPYKKASLYFYYKKQGLQNQSVLYVTKDLSTPGHILLDPNSFSKDGTVALSGLSVSPDGKYAAYGISRSGSDWIEWKVRDIATGKDLPDFIQWTKFTSASWSKDSEGFYYSRFPKPQDEKSDLNYFQKVYYHRLGTVQDSDELVFENPNEKEWGFNSEVSEDGNYLFIGVYTSTENKNLLFYKDLRKPNSSFICLIDAFEAEYSVLANEKSFLFVKTNLDAPKGRIISIDLEKPEKSSWKELIPESKETIESASVVGEKIVLSYLKDAHSEVRVFDLEGKLIHDVELPGVGTVAGFRGQKADTETYYLFTGFTTPSTVYKFDLLTGQSTKVFQPQIGFNPDDYETKQVFYTSKDGTRIPMFISYKKGIELSGTNPTYLYGYGGFNISITPQFTVPNLVWMEMGGILAIPSLRGGGEYGEAWHEAGKKSKKQNVFDDFIAAAQWLIDHKYTSSSRLAIGGGSNGGLLVGATLTQRPDLFSAALPRVGVLDMLRFQEFSAGRYWVDEYGCSENPADFKYLYAYSPYHNVKDGTRYPATMVLTGDHDNRVVPAHSFKFAAALQKAQAGRAPVLIRIDTNAGHGAGKPTSKQIDEAADMWAFVLRAFGIL